eukprot:350781-Chlamydomonas_euryale.AAC.3
MTDVVTARTARISPPLLPNSNILTDASLRGRTWNGLESPRNPTTHLCARVGRKSVRCEEPRDTVCRNVQLARRLGPRGASSRICGDPRVGVALELLCHSDALLAVRVLWGRRAGQGGQTWSAGV